MIEGIDVNQRIEFSSIKDTGEIKTIFVIKPMNGEERANFSDNSKIVLSGTRLYDFLASCIVEIKNFNIEGDVRTKLVSIKDDEVIAELVNKIGSINKMTGQDQKN